MKQIDYDILLQHNKAMHEHIQDLEQDLQNIGQEASYMDAFISHMNLTDEYIYFREHAREVYDEDHPFPTITL